MFIVQLIGCLITIGFVMLFAWAFGIICYLVFNRNNESATFVYAWLFSSIVAGVCIVQLFMLCG